jgi:hypothetical protein
MDDAEPSIQVVEFYQVQMLSGKSGSEKWIPFATLDPGDDHTMAKQSLGYWRAKEPDLKFRAVNVVRTTMTTVKDW